MALSMTPEQSAILNWFRSGTGRALTVAVAGAGKTTILLEGIKVLATERGVRSDDILMTTFAKRGALDMERRAAELAVPRGVEYRTLHSVALEMIRLAGHRRRIEVAKDWHQVRVVKTVLKAVYEEDRSRELPKPGEVMKAIGLAKAALVWPDAWTASDGTEFPGYLAWASAQEGITDLDDAATFNQIVERAYRALEEAMSAPESHGFDLVNTRLVSFDDMLGICARAILRAERKDRWVLAQRGAFPWTLVDEVQDNNLAQWTLVKFLAGDGNLMAVGDDQQSIFGFRGAMPEQMRKFLDEGATLFTLSKNWRSGWKVLDGANAILDGAQDRIWQGGLVAGRGREFVGCATVAEYDTPGDEARQVVQDMADAIEDGTNPEEIAALYRLNACSGPLEAALIARGIAYRVAGASFFNRPVIRAAVGFLAVALDEADENRWRFGSSRYPKSALETCYNTPTRYLGNKFLRQYETLRDVRNAPRRELGRWKRGAADLLAAVDGVQYRLADEGVTAALEHLFADKADGGVGLVEFYRDEAASAEDVTDTDLAAQALVECSESLNTAEQIVEFALSMVGEGDGQGSGRDNTPRVTLTTVHRSKGLEWDRTYVVGMSNGLFPFRRGDTAEERRLAYVATTRAKGYCQVSWTRLTSDGKPAGASVHALEYAGRLEGHDEGEEAVTAA